MILDPNGNPIKSKSQNPEASEIAGFTQSEIEKLRKLNDRGVLRKKSQLKPAAQDNKTAPVSTEDKRRISEMCAVFGVSGFECDLIEEGLSLAGSWDRLLKIHSMTDNKRGRRAATTKGR